MRTYIVAVDYIDISDHSLYTAHRTVRADNERAAEMIAANQVESDHDYMVDIHHADCIEELTEISAWA